MQTLIGVGLMGLLITASAQQAPEAKRSIGTFKTLALIVENVSDAAVQLGLTTKDIQEIVVGALSSKQMLSKVTVDEKPPCPCLYVSLNFAKATFASLAMRSANRQDDFRSDDYFYSLTFSIVEPVVGSRDGSRVLAHTWDVGAVRETPGVPSRSYITDSIRDLAGQFAEAIQQGEAAVGKKP